MVVIVKIVIIILRNRSYFRTAALFKSGDLENLKQQDSLEHIIERSSVYASIQGGDE